MDVPEAALGRAWTDDRAWAFLTDLTELGSRMAGGSGERRAAELVADALDDAGGRAATVEEFEMQRWKRGATDLAVTDPVERTFEGVALPYSPPGDVRGDLVDVGHGTPEEIDDADVSGAVVVASTDTPDGYGRFLHRMEKFGHAAAAGAEAFLFRNHVPGQLPPTGSLGFDREAAIPGVGVSRETGDWLTDYAARDGRAALSVDAVTEPGAGRNAHAVFGPEDGEEVVVLAHHDAHDVAEGALDNGCGITVAVQTARILSACDPELRVRVAGVGAEEVGLLGAAALADRLDLDRVHAAVNVDGAGRFRTLRAHTHTSDAVREAVERVADRAAHPVEVETPAHPFSDHWPFLREGVPALQLHSVRGASHVPGSASGPAPGASEARGRGWGHTAADTRDKVDRRNLREHAMLAALLVAELAEADLPRVETDQLVESFRDRNFEQGMRAAGVWPEGWS